MATLMPAAVASATTSTRSFFMTSSLFLACCGMPAGRRPERGTGADVRLRCHPPGSRGCQHGDVASAAEPADLVREACDIDRLLEAAGKSADGLPLERCRTQCDHGNRGCSRRAREEPGSFCTVHVRQPKVHQDDVRTMLGSERESFRAVARNE